EAGQGSSRLLHRAQATVARGRIPGAARRPRRAVRGAEGGGAEAAHGGGARAVRALGTGIEVQSEGEALKAKSAVGSSQLAVLGLPVRSRQSVVGGRPVELEVLAREAGLHPDVVVRF